eukprot:6475565-Amphidinium_carterae.2
MVQGPQAPGSGHGCCSLSGDKAAGNRAHAGPRRTDAWCRVSVYMRPGIRPHRQHPRRCCVEGRGRMQPTHAWYHDVAPHAEDLCASNASASLLECAYTPAHRPWGQYALLCLRGGGSATMTTLRGHMCE